MILPLFTFTAFYNKVSKKRVDARKKKSLSSGIYSCLKNPINNYEDIKGKNIGVVKSVKFLSMFKEKYKGISFNTILYDDVGSMINGLKSH